MKLFIMYMRYILIFSWQYLCLSVRLSAVQIQLQQSAHKAGAKELPHPSVFVKTDSTILPPWLKAQQYTLLNFIESFDQIQTEILRGSQHIIGFCLNRMMVHGQMYSFQTEAIAATIEGEEKRIQAQISQRQKQSKVLEAERQSLLAQKWEILKQHPHLSSRQLWTPLMTLIVKSGLILSESFMLVAAMGEIMAVGIGELFPLLIFGLLGFPAMSEATVYFFYNRFEKKSWWILGCIIIGNGVLLLCLWHIGAMRSHEVLSDSSLNLFFLLSVALYVCCIVAGILGKQTHEGARFQEVEKQLKLNQAKSELNQAESIQLTAQKIELQGKHNTELRNQYDKRLFVQWYMWYGLMAYRIQVREQHRRNAFERRLQALHNRCIVTYELSLSIENSTCLTAPENWSSLELPPSNIVISEETELFIFKYKNQTNYEQFTTTTK